MAWIPIVAGSRRRNSRRSSAGSVCVAFIFSLVILGVLFSFFFGSFGTNRFGFTPLIFFNGFIIFIVILIFISTISMSISETNKKPKREDLRTYQPLEQYQQINPYKIRDPIQEQSDELINEVIPREIPVINYCRYCGAKIDRDAIFCHLCGTRL